jgi:hypothetical protein
MQFIIISKFFLLTQLPHQAKWIFLLAPLVMAPRQSRKNMVHSLENIFLYRDMSSGGTMFHSHFYIVPHSALNNWNNFGFW